MLCFFFAAGQISRFTLLSDFFKSEASGVIIVSLEQFSNGPKL